MRVSIFFILLFGFNLLTIATENSPHNICTEMGQQAKNNNLINSINDVSTLNQTSLSCVIAPKSTDEIVYIVKSINAWNQDNPPIHISIAGARHSQGGHIASQNGIVLDMRQLNKVYAPEQRQMLWTVKAEAGALWSDVHEKIRLHSGTSLANKVQQSSTPFTVGGTLSVNAHGRSFSYGSVIHSVERLTIVLPDGSVTEASRTENEALFRLAIGGFGLFGVIVDVTLELHENHFLVPESDEFKSPERYLSSIEDTLNNVPRHNIQRDENGKATSEALSPVAFMFATISLTQDEFMTSGTAYSYRYLKDLDLEGNLNPDPMPGLLNPKALATKIGFGLKRKGKLIAVAQKAQRNFLMTQDTRLKVLTPPINAILAATKEGEPDLLQEYFIPVAQIPAFIKHVKSTFERNGVQLSNASLRFIPKTHDSSFLSYESSTQDQFALVLYFALEINQQNIIKAESWTRSLVEKAIELEGRYYLPYQQWPTKSQFQRAYPNFKLFRQQKMTRDPNDVFSNRFYQFYIKET